MVRPRYSCLLLLVACISCHDPAMNQYRLLVKDELKNQKKVNDIFFGISLGMSSKDFYMHCWTMNKEGVFTDGSSNTSVLYKLENGELQHPAEMNFYPEFHNDKIYVMAVKFKYTGWSPWNKQLGSENLLKDVFTLYKKWYAGGNPFLTIHDEKRGVIYVKVDGNRRIIIGSYDDVEVKVDYSDLYVNGK